MGLYNVHVLSETYIHMNLPYTHTHTSLHLHTHIHSTSDPNSGCMQTLHVKFPLLSKKHQTPFNFKKLLLNHK